MLNRTRLVLLTVRLPDCHPPRPTTSPSSRSRPAASSLSGFLDLTPRALVLRAERPGLTALREDGSRHARERDDERT